MLFFMFTLSLHVVYTTVVRMRKPIYPAIRHFHSAGRIEVVCVDELLLLRSVILCVDGVVPGVTGSLMFFFSLDEVAGFCKITRNIASVNYSCSLESD